MIIVMKAGAPKEELQSVLRTIEELGYTPHVIHGTQRNVPRIASGLTRPGWGVGQRRSASRAL